jgi:hypothetical protein
VRNRLRARIFTVDIRRRERKIPPVRFPNSDTNVRPPGMVLGMRLHSIRKKPARRNYNE